MSKQIIPGIVGPIEIALDGEQAQPRGVVLLAHPHPLFGGTMDNKVVTTLMRTFVQLGYLVVRSNFRGVGQTAGEHTAGVGETDDLLAVLDFIEQHEQRRYAGLPLILAGFSFGSFVQTHVAQRLVALNRPASRLVLVGTATSRWEVLPVPADTLVIHGEQDDTVPLQSVLDWARPQSLPVVVVPGADHFFHGKLPTLKQIVFQAWAGVNESAE
ncbi:alpha/beta hydrolase [Parvibium lacunae]|uniref:Alpha/beta hydrolase n=1 Tax=Parvibium lacunae TaxID=1888893 RepID=A0A368KZZ2_9BURK|nr:alpha/beta hydrolase [Parvibium lacunae]RCS56875.1 alpha/beta hydrolase [Parvibium lacunae]